MKVEEIDLRTQTAGLSFAGRAVFAVAYGLTVQLQSAEVPTSSIRSVLGLSADAWDGVSDELTRDGAWFKVGEHHVQLMCASALLSRAIGAPGRPKASAWAELRGRVFGDAGPDARCTYCGSANDLCVDHIVAVELGGSNHLANLTIACKTCNSAKGALPWYEWVGKVKQRGWW